MDLSYSRKGLHFPTTTIASANHRGVLHGKVFVYIGILFLFVREIYIIN